MRDAFRRQGVDVRTVGPHFGAQCWGLQLEASRVWVGDGTIDTVWPDWTPELVIYSLMPPYQFNPRYRGIPHVVDTVDNHFYNFRQEGINHYFLAHLNTPVMPVEKPSDTWLPCAYDPVAFTPSPIPWSARQFDVVMLGAMYPNRLQMVGAMRRAGIALQAGNGEVYDQYRDIYHRARISLCLSACGDVAQRIFETAAMKCLVLTDACADFAPLNADGLVIYQNILEAVEKVKYWLANPAAAETMIERSAAWAKPHTWDARAQTILNWLAANPHRRNQ
jgi:hypothetical protein